MAGRRTELYTELAHSVPGGETGDGFRCKPGGTVGGAQILKGHTAPRQGQSQG